MRGCQGQAARARPRNVIERGAHYGWPYCYADGKAGPEYAGVDCTRFHFPYKLLLAHAAPLGMAYYVGELLPAQYRGSLIIGYHGYRKHGRRVVAFATDARGLPQGEAEAGRPIGGGNACFR